MACISRLSYSTSLTLSGQLDRQFRQMAELLSHCQISERRSQWQRLSRQTVTLELTHISESSVLVVYCARLTLSRSWTIITWVIISGSSLVMLLWIILYSFFETFDFADEARRLLGGVTFWAAVVLSVAIALRE